MIEFDIKDIKYIETYSVYDVLTTGSSSIEFDIDIGFNPDYVILSNVAVHHTGSVASLIILKFDLIGNKILFALPDTNLTTSLDSIWFHGGRPVNGHHVINFFDASDDTAYTHNSDIELCFTFKFIKMKDNII